MFEFYCAACLLGQVSTMCVATGMYMRMSNPNAHDNKACFLGCCCG